MSHLSITTCPFVYFVTTPHTHRADRVRLLCEFLIVYQEYIRQAAPVVLKCIYVHFVWLGLPPKPFVSWMTPMCSFTLSGTPTLIGVPSYTLLYIIIYTQLHFCILYLYTVTHCCILLYLYTVTHCRITSIHS
ncbi:hypothetical protein XENTR_v10003610 [Xenopus tropicalis]|nr:hypothetical protein XENTR_v10003610 [Xenopus tropicalis]